MNRWRKPVLVNSIIVATLFIINGISATTNENSVVPRFALSGTVVLLLALVNLVIGMVHNRDKKADGLVYIALSGILLLIGFSVCSAPVIFK